MTNTLLTFGREVIYFFVSVATNIFSHESSFFLQTIRVWNHFPTLLFPPSVEVAEDSVAKCLPLW